MLVPAWWTYHECVASSHTGRDTTARRARAHARCSKCALQLRGSEPLWHGTISAHTRLALSAAGARKSLGKSAAERYAPEVNGTILIVDDDEDTAVLLRDSLRKRGFDVDA